VLQLDGGSFSELSIRSVTRSKTEMLTKQGDSTTTCGDLKHTLALRYHTQLVISSQDPEDMCMLLKYNTTETNKRRTLRSNDFDHAPMQIHSSHGLLQCCRFRKQTSISDDRACVLVPEFMQWQILFESANTRSEVKVCMLRTALRSGESFSLALLARNCTDVKR